MNIGVPDINIRMATLIENNINKADVYHAVRFHDRLNIRLWGEGGDLRLEVRVALLKAALAFAEFLELPSLKVEDVILTGSSAAYNYTDYSDLDVHLIVDFDRAVCPDLAANFFNTKKSLWNERHDIYVRDYPVEMYVEDTKQPVTANGVYSLLKGKWIKKPSKIEPAFDDSAVLMKVEHLADQIDEVLDEKKPIKAQIYALITRIRRMRKAGLATGGEFSVENLSFKTLRNLGYIDRLYRADEEVEDRDLSLESEHQ